MDFAFGLFSYALLAGILLQIIITARTKRIFTAALPLIAMAGFFYWIRAPEGLLLESLQPAYLRGVPYLFMAAAFLVTPVFFRLTGRRRKKNKKKETAVRNYNVGEPFSAEKNFTK